MLPFRIRRRGSPPTRLFGGGGGLGSGAPQGDTISPEGTVWSLARLVRSSHAAFRVLCLLLFSGGVECTVELYVQSECVECSILLIGKLD